jgi:iron complex transport system ATP-binding protein
MNAIQVDNLSFDYPHTRVFSHLSFSIPVGTFLAILGPNGSGKTTLLHLLARLLKPKTGSIHLSDQLIQSLPITRLSRLLSLVRQEFPAAFDFTVAEMVMMGRTSRFGWFGFESPSDQAAVEEALVSTHLSDLADRKLCELSSGQRQRAFIARAIAQDTPIILLDEPTAFLDLKHQIIVLELLKRLNQNHQKTIITTIHDLNLASQFVDRIMFLGSESRYFIGPAKEALSKERIETFFEVTGLISQQGQSSFFLPTGIL